VHSIANACGLNDARGHALQDIDHSKYVLTDESVEYLEKGSPEAQVYGAVPAEGITLPQLKVGPS
jgi:hypothetical protein